jgi:diadenosine tetraphosphatase ApaH/serine/threonine PP2A family protein phosphatase
MRYAILADIHGNLEAFEAVREDIEQRGGVDELWCLGDIVGYGPNPRECLELLRQKKHICLAGNHDGAAIGKIDTSDFNPDAAAACHWTAKQLTSEDVDYLGSLPLKLVRDNFTLVHGSPREPIWEYILSPQIARINFSYFETQFCLVAHSHITFIFDYSNQNGVCQLRQLPEELYLSDERNRLIINCGGVGQPRDGDPRASYAIFDDEEGVIYHYRLPYDISATQKKMLQAGLPARLATRLSYGR